VTASASVPTTGSDGGKKPVDAPDRRPAVGVGDSPARGGSIRDRTATYFSGRRVLSGGMAGDQSTSSGVLDPHVPHEEDLVASETGDGRVVAVTDRRVISLSEGSTGTREQREIESVLLTSDSVVGTEYSRSDSENKGTLQRIVGAVVALVGLFVLLGATQVDGGVQAALLAFGLLAVVVGALIYWTAEDTMEGGVSITVRRAGDVPDRTWTFPRGHTTVPQAISEQVATVHGPE
jgi:hypothetical protein